MQSTVSGTDTKKKSTRLSKSERDLIVAGKDIGTEKEFDRQEMIATAAYIGQKGEASKVMKLMLSRIGLKQKWK